MFTFIDRRAPASLFQYSRQTYTDLVSVDGNMLKETLPWVFPRKAKAWLRITEAHNAELREST